jgi:hypothetical protein
MKLQLEKLILVGVDKLMVLMLGVLQGTLQATGIQMSLDIGSVFQFQLK